jgi:hypothetical protein
MRQALAIVPSAPTPGPVWGGAAADQNLVTLVIHYVNCRQKFQFKQLRCPTIPLAAR